MYKRQLLHGATTLSLTVHIPLFALTALLAWKLPTGHPLAIRPATVSQLFGVAFAYPSTPPFNALHPWVPLFIAAQAIVVLLLWVPRSSRSHTAQYPRSSYNREAPD